MAEPTNQEVGASTQQPSGQSQVASQQASQAKVEQPVQQPEVKTETTLPSGTSERTTEQFDKLLDSNKRLFETNQLLRQELDKRTQSAEVFRPIQQPNVQQVNPNDFMEVDEYGNKFVNEVKLQGAIENVNSQVVNTQRVMQEYIQAAEQREIDRQENEAFVAHPELNPNKTSFDSQLSDFTRALIYDSLINPQAYGGKSLTFKQAADVVKSRIDKGEKPKTMDETVAKNQSVQTEGSAQEAKEQGSLAATGQSQAPARAQQQEADLEELRTRTKIGTGPDSTWAIAQRLQNVDHVGVAETSETKET